MSQEKLDVLDKEEQMVSHLVNMAGAGDLIREDIYPNTSAHVQKEAPALAETQPPKQLIVIDNYLPDPETLKNTGRYGNLKVIAVREHGIVWQATDLHFGVLDGEFVRNVCLKELRKASSSATEKTELILECRREAQLMAYVSELSPYIQRVYDFFINDLGNPVIVLELNRGKDLGALIEESRYGLSTENIITMLSQLAEAIDIANAHGVIHGDIKPENILWENGFFKITDFGISPHVIGRSAQYLSGTPGFIPPETIQATGDDQNLEHADVYALAVVTYNCLCKQLHIPEKQDPVDTAFSVATTDSTPITKHLVFKKRVWIEGLNEQKIEAVFKKALARNPQERYQTAQEFAVAMIEALMAPPERPALSKIKMTVGKILFGVGL